MKYYTSIFVKGLQSYHKSKLEFGKNICRSARFEPMHPGSAELADIFSELQLWPLVSLQPLDQNQCLVLHLKDLLRICLGIKAQSFWKTFALESKKVWNRSFKWGTKHWFWSRGCKDTRGQSWSLEKISADQPGSNPCARGQPSWQIFFPNSRFAL